jgi:hypothetical protein
LLRPPQSHGKTEHNVAQEATDTPGSPDAATTIDGRYLPPPPFGGEINDGWMLSAVPVLYDVGHDWTQYTDVAAANPAKLREMTDLMFGEFAKYQVLPLDASVATRMVAPRPSMSGGRKVFTYSGEPVTGIPCGTAPRLLNTSYSKCRRAAPRA